MIKFVFNDYFVMSMNVFDYLMFIFLCWYYCVSFDINYFRSTISTEHCTSKSNLTGRKFLAALLAYPLITNLNFIYYLQIQYMQASLRC